MAVETARDSRRAAIVAFMVALFGRSWVESIRGDWRRLTKRRDTSLKCGRNPPKLRAARRYRRTIVSDIPGRLNVARCRAANCRNVPAVIQLGLRKSAHEMGYNNFRRP